jgi:high-affinity Fe2+/Pb2+ permease
MIEVIKLKEEKGEVVISKEDFEGLISEVEFEGLISEVESLIETVEILSDEKLMKQIRESERDIKEGRIHDIKSTEDLRRLFLE